MTSCSLRSTALSSQGWSDTVPVFHTVIGNPEQFNSSGLLNPDPFQTSKDGGDPISLMSCSTYCTTFPVKKYSSGFRMSQTELSKLQFVVTALWYIMSYYQEKKQLCHLCKCPWSSCRLQLDTPLVSSMPDYTHPAPPTCPCRPHAPPLWLLQ